MRLLLRKIGNSHGVILPLEILRACGFYPGAVIKATVEGRRLVLEETTEPAPIVRFTEVLPWQQRKPSFVRFATR